MLFPHPNKQTVQEQIDEEKLLLKEVLNDKPKKIKKIEEELFNQEPSSILDK